MMPNHTFLLKRAICFALAFLPVLPAPAAENTSTKYAKELTLCSWNAENLFDTIDDPANEGDDPYTPRGWRRWSNNRYQMKLEHLAEIIATVKPDILCLQEVENRKVLEDLAQVLKTKHHLEYPHIIHKDSTDFRGIDVAIIANTPAEKTEWIRPDDGLRDSVVASFPCDGAPLTIIANHWKSRLGKSEESLAKRKAQAQCVRKKLDELIAANSNAAIVVTGDFNDGPESLPMQEALMLTNRTAALSFEKNRALFNLASLLPATEKGTYYYGPADKWDMLDSISVTATMLKEKSSAPWIAVENSYRVVKYKKHLDRYGSPAPFRRIRNRKVGDVYATGFSDHFPVSVKLKRADDK